MSCEDCFLYHKPELCELFRNHFVQVSDIYPLKKSIMERILSRSNIQFGLIDRDWGFVVDITQRGSIVQQLRDVGITIHTLENHVEILKSRYNKTIRKMGEPVYVSLPLLGSWFQFDPQKRIWTSLYTFKTAFKNEIGANALNRSVLKCRNNQGDSYFMVITSNDNKPNVIRVRKKAAYDIIGTMFEPSQAFWIPSKNLSVAIIQRIYLKNIPDLIFNTLVRFKPVKDHIDGAFVFEIGDFELIKEILSWIKTELVESSEIVKMPGDIDKLRGTPIISLENLNRDDVFNIRLHSLLLMLEEIGGSINELSDHIVISGVKCTVNLYFIERERSFTDGGIVYVALKVLSDPSKILELLKMLKNKTGLYGLNIEKILVQAWPLLVLSDLEFVTDSIVKYYESEREFVPSIINTQKRYESLQRWLNEAKTGSIKTDLKKIIIIEKVLKQSDKFI